MDELADFNQDDNFLNNDRISPNAKENLHKSSVWVKLIAIVGITGSGIGALFSLFFIFINPATVILNLLIYAIAIYISSLLLNISKSVNRDTFNTDKFADNFFKYWKILGIFTMVAIILSIISIIFFVSQGAALLQNLQY